MEKIQLLNCYYRNSLFSLVWTLCYTQIEFSTVGASDKYGNVLSMYSSRLQRIKKLGVEYQKYFRVFIINLPMKCFLLMRLNFLVFLVFINMCVAQFDNDA